MNSNFDNYTEKLIEWYSEPSSQVKMEQAWCNAKEIGENISKEMRLTSEKLRKVIGL